MNTIPSDFKVLLNNIDLNKGDTVMLVSDITKLIIEYKKKKKNFDINSFIDAVLDKIGNDGTLLIPTYNYDFCNGIAFNYLNTPTTTGSLGKIALKRKDFTRTINPIHSFVVAGKDKNIICNLEHYSSFGKDSPFHYLYKAKAKYFSIGLDFTNLGFTPAHYVEEMIGVPYRYFKIFNGDYIDKNNIKKRVKYKFYVRDKTLTSGTGIKKETKEKLIDLKAYKNYLIDNVEFEIIKLNIALDFLLNNIKNNNEEKRLIFPFKKNAKIIRSKINISNLKY